MSGPVSGPVSGPDGPGLDAEFDLVMARAGLPVPADWRAGAVASYAELMALTALLRPADRPVGSEPSAVYRMREGGDVGTSDG
ncbi:hypothetical protein [Streptomyces coerulescens]|uniref:Uncharacterized protein n=1 Tax=Streptomyces coerulescens TaxID=29304 RepID=A0ABW0CIC0_STRCD